jgi:hypothetical protein
VDNAAVWQRAIIPVTIVGQPAYTLGAEDWVLHQAAHAFYKHRRIDLLTLVDLDRMIRYLGCRFDWDMLMRIAEDNYWRLALEATLLPLVKTDCPVPQNVIQFCKDYHLPAFEIRLLRWWLKQGRPERYHIFPDW